MPCFCRLQFRGGYGKNNAYLFEAAGKVPVFILNGYLAGDRIYSVLCDDRLAVNEMTESLFRRGSHAPVYLYRSLSYSGRKNSRLPGSLHKKTEY